MKQWPSLLMMMFLIIFLSACNNDYPIETNLSETVADFSFTNQAKETVKLDDLKGTWWIADFIFTNCETVCLPMTANLTVLQEEMANNDLPVEIISFSVDPDFDSPEVLTEYANEYEIDFSNWNFLTGYDFQTIKELSIKSFRAYLKEPDKNSDQVTHDTRFFLIDPEGNIVKGYDGVDRKNIELIMDDLKALHAKNLL